MVNDIYNSGNGSNTISKVVVGNYAKFPIPTAGYKNNLTCFSQILCLKTCFSDKFCNLLANECTSLSLHVLNGNKIIYTLADKIKLSEWPGKIELLETVLIDCVYCYTVRLTLDIEKLFCCPLTINSFKLRLTIENNDMIQVPVEQFIMVGCKKEK